MPRRSGKTKEKFKTRNDVFDKFTSETLFRLISRGYFEGLESPISIGKESNVFSALRKDNVRVMVKIYRLETCDFNRMYDYIKSDPRFPKLKKGRRKIIFSWVQREFRNLLKAREAGVNVPTPLAFLNNVLVLEFIGSGNVIAPQLKDKKPEDSEKFFGKVIGNVKKLYKARIVHGDLSAFNILNNSEIPVLIDFSQATTLDDPNSLSYLERDVRNLCIFFRKLGMEINAKKIMDKLK